LTKKDRISAIYRVIFDFKVSKIRQKSRKFVLTHFVESDTIPSSTLKKDKVAVTFVSTGFPPLLISKKMLYGNATLK